MLGDQRVDLAVADAVLAGRGAAHRQGAGNHGLIHGDGFRHLRLVQGVDDEDDMEVAVADMADDGGEQSGLVDLAPGLDDAPRQGGDRHADVRRPSLGAGAKRQRRVISVGARPPEALAFFRAAGPAERAAAEILDQRADGLGLFLNAPVRAVELEEQRRGDRAVELGIFVDGVDLDLVEELDPRHRDAHLDGGDDGVDRALEVLERTDGG